MDVVKKRVDRVTLDDDYSFNPSLRAFVIVVLYCRAAAAANELLL